MESAVHLGHVLHESGTMDKDSKSKRASFIDDSVHIREGFAPREVQFAIVEQNPTMLNVTLYQVSQNTRLDRY